MMFRSHRHILFRCDCLRADDRKSAFQNFIELAQMGGKLPANKLPSAINSVLFLRGWTSCSRTITDRPEERWDNIGEIKADRRRYFSHGREKQSANSHFEKQVARP